MWNYYNIKPKDFVKDSFVWKEELKKITNETCKSIFHINSNIISREGIPLKKYIINSEKGLDKFEQRNRYRKLIDYDYNARKLLTDDQIELIDSLGRSPDRKFTNAVSIAQARGVNQSSIYSKWHKALDTIGEFLEIDASFDTLEKYWEFDAKSFFRDSRSWNEQINKYTAKIKKNEESVRFGNMSAAEAEVDNEILREEIETCEFYKEVLREILNTVSPEDRKVLEILYLGSKWDDSYSKLGIELNLSGKKALNAVENETIGRVEKLVKEKYM